jgi:hypothetical protein
MNAPLGGTMPWSNDLDQICSYLTGVRLDGYGGSGKGMTGAAVLDDAGLIWGLGSNSVASFQDRAPWAVGMMQENAEFALRFGLKSPDFLLLQDVDDFLYCRKFLDQYYYVVTGSRGSFELFTGRIDRCIQMAETALKERRTATP